MEWVDAFNKIARNENNLHSFYIHKTGEDIQATPTLEEVAPAEQCRGRRRRRSRHAGRQGDAGNDNRDVQEATATGYAADYTKTAAERLDLGDDPELLNYIKSIKSEGGFIAR